MRSCIREVYRLETIHEGASRLCAYCKWDKRLQYYGFHWFPLWRVVQHDPHANDAPTSFDNNSNKISGVEAAHATAGKCTILLSLFFVLCVFAYALYLPFSLVTSEDSFSVALAFPLGEGHNLADLVLVTLLCALDSIVSDTPYYARFVASRAFSVQLFPLYVVHDTAFSVGRGDLYGYLCTLCGFYSLALDAIVYMLYVLRYRISCMYRSGHLSCSCFGRKIQVLRGMIAHMNNIVSLKHEVIP